MATKVSVSYKALPVGVEVDDAKHWTPTFWSLESVQEWVTKTNKTLQEEFYLTAQEYVIWSRTTTTTETDWAVTN